MQVKVRLGRPADQPFETDFIGFFTRRAKGEAATISSQRRLFINKIDAMVVRADLVEHRFARPDGAQRLEHAGATRPDFGSCGGHAHKIHRLDLFDEMLEFVRQPVGRVGQCLQRDDRDDQLRLRPLALALAQRSPLLPNVPTVVESGLPKFTITSWCGVFAPAKTPTAIVEMMSREITAVLKRPEIVESLFESGTASLGSTPEEFGSRVRADIERWRKVIKDTGIQIE